MNIFLFGNGNLSFADYLKMYAEPLWKIGFGWDIRFTVCDFRGVETLTMEFLKSETEDVSVYHIGETPRYLPDRFKPLIGLIQSRNLRRNIYQLSSVICHLFRIVVCSALRNR